MKKKLSLFILLAFALSACNLPSAATDQPSIEDQAATIVAQTLSAAAPATPGAPGTPRTPLSSPAPGTPSPTATLTPTITPTYSTPMLRINESTNCRTGPGQEYEIVFTFLPGASTEIVAHYPADNYWVVKLPNNNNTCWVWGEYATPSGSYWAVPSTTPPPPATQVPPAAPSIQEWTFNCNVGQMTVSIQWTDRAADESGYRIIRDEETAAELPADSKSYTETIPYTAGDKFVYFVEVYNASGTVRSTPVQFTCP